MSQPGNPAGGETPPLSPSQTSPSQTHVTTNNESHIINEPSQPLNNAGGRRAPLGIEEPRQPPLGANQESHIINEQVPPPHDAIAIAIAGRRTPPSRPQRVGIGEPRETRLLQPRRAADGIEAPRPQRHRRLEQHRLRHYLTHQELPFINEPFLPLNDDGGRRAPPSLPRPLEIEEPRQRPPLGANQESHIINEQVPPPHDAIAIAGRRTPPSRPQRVGIGEPRETRLQQPRRAADGIEASRPQRHRRLEQHRLRHYLTYKELPFINEPFMTPHRAADGRRTQPSPSSQKQIGIQDPGQPLSRVNKESLTNRQPSPPLYLRPSQQHALRVNQESHTIKKPSPSLYSAGQRTSSRALKDQPLQYQQHPLRVNQESHTMKKLSSSSKDRRGGVVARRCANRNNTSTTLWRSDPTGQKSLCNASGIRLNREEETRAASELQASNVSSAALRSHLEEVRNRVELMENNANPDETRDNSPGDPPEEATQMKEWQSWINKSPDNSPGA